jgi:hypothetical protein
MSLDTLKFKKPSDVNVGPSPRDVTLPRFKNEQKKEQTSKWRKFTNPNPDEDKGTIRMVHPLAKSPRSFLVIKLFKPDDDNFATVKFWTGANVEDVASHWQTSGEVTPVEADINRALHVIKTLEASFDIAVAMADK